MARVDEVMLEHWLEELGERALAEVVLYVDVIHPVEPARSARRSSTASWYLRSSAFVPFIPWIELVTICHPASLRRPIPAHRQFQANPPKDSTLR
jgi:hypothetical protein